MYTSHTSDSATPMITPASTPAVSTPTIAATAIQKSTRATRCSRRISATSIIPNTTASMITAASTGLGSSENTGASTSSVSTISDARRQRGQRCLGAGLVVERARREARRHRDPLEHTGTDVGHALRHRLLVDVDPVAVLRGERAGVAGRLREADQQQPERGGADRGEVVDHEARTRDLGAAKPRGTSPTRAMPRSSKSNSADATSPPMTSTSAPGTLSGEKRIPTMTSEGHDTDEQRGAVDVAEAADPVAELPP